MCHISLGGARVHAYEVKIAHRGLVLRITDQYGMLKKIKERVTDAQESRFIMRISEIDFTSLLFMKVWAC